MNFRAASIMFHTFWSQFIRFFWMLICHLLIIGYENMLQDVHVFISYLISVYFKCFSSSMSEVY